MNGEILLVYLPMQKWAKIYLWIEPASANGWCVWT